MEQTFIGKPGDLIEIFRDKELYQHWAVYIGENEVVLFTTDGGLSSGLLDNLSISIGNEFHQSLINVVGQKPVNELLDGMNQMMCCKHLNYNSESYHFFDFISSSTGKVKREKFTDVVGNDRYQVNNLLDDMYKARDPSIIVKEACEMVGRVLQYNVVSYNCEHFAIEMRYGKAESRQFKGKPGDLIEINRGLYKDWAVYIGGQMVVHFTAEGGDSYGWFTSLSSSTGKVKREKLSDVVGHHRFKVNNLLDEEYEARGPSIIVKEACEMVGREPQYNVVSYNCEHFATEMRYGKAKSRQFNGKPGDLIQINRGPYQHWAVYIGGKEVINFTTEGGQSSGSLELLSSSTGKVKREKFADVVDNHHYQVNNLLDKMFKPRDPSIIVKEACEMVGREPKYDLDKYNSEHFAKDLRYGKAASRQFNGKPGDLIQIFRNRFYEHWAVYIGEDEVVHFTTDGVKWYGSFKILSISSSSSTEFRQTLIDVIGQKRYKELQECMNQTRECNIIGMDGIELIHSEDLNFTEDIIKMVLDLLISEIGYVKRAKLADWVKDDRYQINNGLDEKYKPRDPSIIVEEAIAMVGQELKYNIFTYNCEHFATKMRYGVAESRQIQEAASIFGVPSVA